MQNFPCLRVPFHLNSSGKPQTDFLHTQHMTEAATGQELAKSLKNIIQECQMELKKMKSCVTDGASAMIGNTMEWQQSSREMCQISSTSTVCNTDLHLHVQMRLKSFKSFRHLTFEGISSSIFLKIILRFLEQSTTRGKIGITCFSPKSELRWQGRLYFNGSKLFNGIGSEVKNSKSVVIF